MNQRKYRGVFNFHLKPIKQNILIQSPRIFLEAITSLNFSDQSQRNIIIFVLVIISQISSYVELIKIDVLDFGENLPDYVIRESEGQAIEVITTELQNWDRRLWYSTLHVQECS